MKRSSERLIDAGVLGMLLTFGYLVRLSQPAILGVVVTAAVQFWLQKNASPTHASQEQAVALAAQAAADAAALAAAQVLDVARHAKDEGAVRPAAGAGVIPSAQMPAPGGPR
jgi:hypothetical protein